MGQVFDALRTGAGMLWKALWALIFGYLISAGIQVLVTTQQMANVLGGRGPRQAGLAGLFGFISSPYCSRRWRHPDRFWSRGPSPRTRSPTTLVIELGIVL